MASGPWPASRRPFSAWFRDHLKVVGELIDFIGHHVVTSLTVWLLVGIAMALPSALFLLFTSVAAVDDVWGGEPGLAVYLPASTTDEVVDGIVAELRMDSGLTDVSVVSPSASLASLEERLGDLSAVAADNPLPITVRATFSSNASADATFARVARMEGVTEVSSDLTWLSRLKALRTLLERLTVVLAVVLGLAAILITFASIRLVLASRLDELFVMNLVGAPRGYIRRPFLYLGGLYGLGGALVAAMLLAASFIYLEAPLADFLDQYALDLEIAGFDPMFLGSLLVSGGLLGVVGSLLASRSRLRSLEITG